MSYELVRIVRISQDSSRSIQARLFTRVTPRCSAKPFAQRGVYLQWIVIFFSGCSFCPCTWCRHGQICTCSWPKTRACFLHFFQQKIQTSPFASSSCCILVHPLDPEIVARVLQAPSMPAPEQQLGANDLQWLLQWLLQWFWLITAMMLIDVDWCCDSTTAWQHGDSTAAAAARSLCQGELWNTWPWSERRVRRIMGTGPGGLRWLRWLRWLRRLRHWSHCPKNFFVSPSPSPPQLPRVEGCWWDKRNSVSLCASAKFIHHATFTSHI